jgi:hypothetical protein
MTYSPSIDRSMLNGVRIKRGKNCYTTSCDTITEIRCQQSPLQSNTVVMSGRSPGFQINAAPILPAVKKAVDKLGWLTAYSCRGQLTLNFRDSLLCALRTPNRKTVKEFRK